MKRANWLGAPEAYNLNQVATVLNAAFGYHSYLVGSCLERRDHRDVDVRCILDDIEFDRLFRSHDLNYSTNGLWSLMCTSISEWLSNRTGLKIDFQIQRQSDANEQYHGRPRNCLGIFRSSDDIEKTPGVIPFVKLTDLNPRWFVLENNGPRVGLTFDCPHCRTQRLGIAFHHRGHEAIDDTYIKAHRGGSPNEHIWDLDSQEDFKTLTLWPSIDASKVGHWHGFITNGEIR